MIPLALIATGIVGISAPAELPPCHPAGDVIPCIHPLHVAGDMVPCSHYCINAFGYTVSCHPAGDVVPCIHSAHFAGDVVPCSHICY